MRTPHLSTGAWIFASAALIVIAVPTGVYAASTVSAVHIQDNQSGNQASVDAEGQQLTATASPSKVVHVFQSVNGSGCVSVYTPPAGKALVLTLGHLHHRQQFGCLQPVLRLPHRVEQLL